MKKILFILILINTFLFSNIIDTLNINGCMECHNIKTSKLAPSFLEIGKSNFDFYGLEARHFLARSIKEGSVGIYKGFEKSKMPAFKNISNQDVDKITQWIIDNYKNKQILKDFN